MRRASLGLCALTVALALPAAAAAAERPALRAALLACSTGSASADRHAVLHASMPARGAHRLALRFLLLEKRDGATRWKRVTAPKLGRWERSEPGRSGLVHTRRVDALRAPARYRAIVQFRWLDAAGRVTARATRRTATCRQPEAQADGA